MLPLLILTSRISLIKYKGLQNHSQTYSLYHVLQRGVVKYNKFAKAWTLASGVGVDVFSSNLVMDADDFICLSAFDWGPVWFTSFSENSGLTLLDNGVRTLEIHNQKLGAGGYRYWQGTNGTNFCIPVCKFPISRYYN